MAPTLLGLPAEVRVEIYSLLFGQNRIILDAGNYVGDSCMIPEHARPETTISRSSQLLRVCKEILQEARPMLYDTTTVHVATKTFAGQLPRTFSNGNPLAGQARHLIWELDCDMMKKFYSDELAMSDDDLDHLDTLELRCRSSAWRPSCCSSDDGNREAFNLGRSQILRYGKLLLGRAISCGQDAQLVEDQSRLGKGEVRMRLCRYPQALRPQDVLVEPN